MNRYKTLRACEGVRKEGKGKERRGKQERRGENEAKWWAGDGEKRRKPVARARQRPVRCAGLKKGGLGNARKNEQHAAGGAKHSL